MVTSYTTLVPGLIQHPNPLMLEMRWNFGNRRNTCLVKSKKTSSVRNNLVLEILCPWVNFEGSYGKWRILVAYCWSIRDKKKRRRKCVQRSFMRTLWLIIVLVLKILGKARKIKNNLTWLNPTDVRINFLKCGWVDVTAFYNSVLQLFREIWWCLVNNSNEVPL